MSAKPPNLVLIMCDQLRADALACYGNELVQTPNITRIARDGVCFDNAYSQTPVCIPARHALISGRNAFELGLLDNAPDIAPIEHPLPEMLRRQGYTGAAVGKMHFQPPRRHHGFDRMILSEEIPEHVADDDYLTFLRGQGYTDVAEPHGQRSRDYYTPQVSELPERVHTTAWTAQESCAVIRRNANRPFFLFTSFIKPHPPFDPCEPYDGLYDPADLPTPTRSEKDMHPDDYLIAVQNDYKVGDLDRLQDEDIQRIRAAYYGAITQLDTQIGTILDALEETGIREETLVVLTADHGEMLGDHRSFGKRTFYEASTRIPMVVSWPKALPTGVRRDQLVTLTDLYATMIDAAGGDPVPWSAAESLLPLCSDAEAVGRARLVGEIGRGPAMKFMLRFDHLKYVYHCNGARENLFDLHADPDELHDIADQHQAVLADCRAHLVEHYRHHGLSEALDGDELVRLPRRDPPLTGFLDQRPPWPATVL